MGYIVGAGRIASYLGAALGILLIIGAVLPGTDAGAGLLYYGTIVLFMSLVGIGATAWLRDMNLEREEVDQYYSIVPNLYRWTALPKHWSLLRFLGTAVPVLIVLCIVQILICKFLWSYGP